MADGLHIHPAGFGLYYSTDGNSYVLLDNLSSVEGPSQERGESEDTTLASPNKFLLATPGWIKGGNVPFVMYLHKTQFATLYGYFTAGTGLYWRALAALLAGETDGSKWEAQGWLAKCHQTKAEKASEEKIMAEFEIHLTALPTFGAGT
jgi:hypothetical protein